MTACLIGNGQTVPLPAIQRLEFAEFRAWILDLVQAGHRIASLFGVGGDPLLLVAVMADDASAKLSVSSTTVGRRYAALTPDCPQAHMFEREIAEQRVLEEARRAREASSTFMNAYSSEMPVPEPEPAPAPAPEHRAAQVAAPSKPIERPSEESDRVYEPAAPVELYNVKEDPGETCNLAPSRDAEASAMRSAAESVFALAGVRDQDLTGQDAHAEMLRNLKSLGYL